MSGASVAWILLGLAPLVIAGGCFAESPTVDAGDTANASTGSATDVSGSMSESADGSTGDEVPGNLVGNGSFEAWTGSTPEGWMPSGGIVELIQGSSDAFDGLSTLQIEASDYGEVRQGFAVPGGVPVGTVVAAEMAYRHVAGDMTPPGIDLIGVRDNGEFVSLSALTTSPFVLEGWTEGGGNVTIEEAFASLRVNLVSGGMQTVEVDDVRVWIVDG